MDYTSLYIAVGLVAIVIAVVNLLIRGIKKKLFDKEFPVKTVDAVIVSKHIGTQVVPLEYVQVTRNLGLRTTIPAYYIDFEGPGVEHSRLMVGEYEFNTFKESDCGKLTFQGPLFKKFEKQ